MKSTIITVFCTLWAEVASAQTNMPLANHVLIGNKGVCFSITDEGYTGSTNLTNWFFDKQIFADAPLHWILDNATNKHEAFVFQRIQHTFSVNLLDTNGNEVPLTDYGQKMNSGPIIHHWPIAASVHMIGLQPGKVDDMDFPALRNLFFIPSEGDYTFEARYWYIPIGSGSKWQLSDPVRLKVIKRPDKRTDGGVTNTPKQ